MTESLLEKKNKELKNKLIAIEQTNKELELIINCIDANIYWKNLDGRILGMNKKNLQTLGLSDITDALNKKDYELNTWKNASSDLVSNDTKVIKNGESYSFEETINIAGTSGIVLLSQKSPLLDTNGKIIGIIGVSLDISKQKRLQRELEEKNKKYEKNKNKTLKAKENILKALTEI